MNRLLLSTLAAVALATPAAAHHETPGKSHAVATVTITESVKANGKPLAPGTYEVWILDEHPDLKAGAPSNVQRRPWPNGVSNAARATEYTGSTPVA